MFIHFLIWVFKFCLLICITYSFRTPKHDSLFYYKTHDSVFLTNPTSHTTSYGIYVAGKTITIDIPTSVANVFDILNWKVVSLNKIRLMFVHNNRPYILINQEIIREMEYSGELSGSIIAFGDNEALHVPTIFNPNLIEPVPKWNYIELLYFDDQSEEVSVKRSLPRLGNNDQDWKLISEWKMTDYIHFDNKLYLLIKRSIWNEKAAKATQEISIIRLCLDKGSELISSAVEIHFTRPEFQTNKIIDLVFVFIFGPLLLEYPRYQLHATQLQSSNNTIYFIYFISNFVPLFEETANECASGSSKITLLRQHLRSEVGGCIKTSYKSCSTKENIVPSRNFSQVGIRRVPTSFNAIYNSRAALVHKIQFVTLPFPYFTAHIFMHTKPIFSTAICEHKSSSTIPTCTNFINNANPDDFLQSAQTNFHINKHPYGVLYVNKESNEIFFDDVKTCAKIHKCTDCIMYGLYSDCIWSNSMCTRDDQPKNKTALTVDHCFKIIKISPLIFNSSSSTILTIQLDEPPVPDSNSREYIVIKAGPHNHCTNITRNGPFFDCTLNLLESGQFKVDVSLQNDEYADVSTISAASIDQVHIFAPERDPDYKFPAIFILFLGLLISSISLIAYIKYNKNKKYVNRFKKFSRTRKVKGRKKFSRIKKGKRFAGARVRSKTLSSTMNTLTGSTFTNEPSIRQVTRWSSIRFVPDHLYLSKQISKTNQ
uniref:Uncharacterized protein n=1 Tax=Tetranychus urticae TaxID=32264 RepID=A0A158P547_TETUR